MTSDAVDDEITWCCADAEHGEGAPPIYSIRRRPNVELGDFGCRHLTDADRRALVSGTVPEHLQPEFGPLTAWGLSGRFRALAEDLVEFKGRNHPRLAEALRALQDAECTALGLAGPYPVVNERDPSGGAATTDAGFADELR